MISMIKDAAGRIRRLVPLGLTALGLAAGTVEARADFAIANPYAYGTGPDQIAIGTLLAFGDSYTEANRRDFPNWAEQLDAAPTSDGRNGGTEVGTLADFAKSGATAGTYDSNNRNSFAKQVKRWQLTSPTFGATDLTVVYLGYNDIIGGTDATGADLTGNSKADYRSILKRLINAGANKGGRRLFLVIPHNVAGAPAYVNDATLSPTMRQRSQIWANVVATTAQSFSNSYGGNIVAVDLYTSIEYVLQHAGNFCLTDVTDVMPTGGDPQHYLYDTAAGGGSIHFGRRGQNLIEQVIQYYLTLGWDWSNQIKRPSSAQAQLTSALNAGQVFQNPCATVPATRQLVASAR